MPGEVSHYSDEFTAVTTVRALTNCDFFVLEAQHFQRTVAEFTGAKEELLRAAVRCADLVVFQKAAGGCGICWVCSWCASHAHCIVVERMDKQAELSGALAGFWGCFPEG